MFGYCFNNDVVLQRCACVLTCFLRGKLPKMYFWHNFYSGSAILVSSSQALQVHPTECLDTPHAAYDMPICHMPYAQIWHKQPYLGIFGHMAYGIGACYMRHVGYPGTQWDVTSQAVKTTPNLHCRNKSYAKYTLLVIFPSENKSKHKHTSGALRHC